MCVRKKKKKKERRRKAGGWVGVESFPFCFLLLFVVVWLYHSSLSLPTANTDRGVGGWVGGMESLSCVLPLLLLLSYVHTPFFSPK